MIPLTAPGIAEAAGVRLIQRGDKPGLSIGRVSTDTRDMQRGCLFVALKGSRYDAHDYLDQALEAGAAALLVSRVSPGLLREAKRKGAAVLQARSTMKAMNRLAASQRSLLEAPVIAVTGSTGKTLTKDFAAAVLGSAGRVTASHASYNNEIGVPLTILDISTRTRFLVLEMGSRGRGHIDELCSLARPDIGVVTNIGWTHMQFFRTRDNLALAKAELLRSLPAEGRAVINKDDDYERFLSRSSPAPVVAFGCSREADVRAENIEIDAEGKATFMLKTKGGGKAEVVLPLPGRHNVENALAAAAVGEIMGVSAESIAESIGKAETTGWRMEMITKSEEITIINDSYNANPVSMRSALTALGDISRKKRAIAVLGDMGELGPVSEEAHKEVGGMAVECGTDILITVGRKARKIAQSARSNGLPKGSVFSTQGVENAAEILRAIIEPGDVILIKGSRFLGLERLVDMVA
ncbi:MAG: UDP-N-acetylmuramoyl-tripeptide--D-alanyl-D-alanine ligase [Actinomycetota bacterium]|nr:UDP-N-acetylmuramoyl-tripeptide--D-alanyl-D-alanine ligase [Actinomycetota bacterium]